MTNLNKIKHILNIPKQSPKIMGRKTLIKEIEMEKAKETVAQNSVETIEVDENTVNNSQE